jgi:calcineurin-like phosphoesterase family protein
MKVFYTADLHVGHSKVILYCNRPFKDVSEMNEEIIRRYNSVVGPDDIVYHLGDFALNEKYVKPTLDRLNGIKHLIVGNHESCFSARTKYKKAIQKYLDYGFTSVQESLEIKIGTTPVLLHHMPFLNPEDKDQRYSQFRPIDKGQWLLHGHVHEKWLHRKRMINVGVDVWNFTPVSEAQITELMADILEAEQA